MSIDPFDELFNCKKMRLNHLVMQLKNDVESLGNVIINIEISDEWSA